MPLYSFLINIVVNIVLEKISRMEWHTTYFNDIFHIGALMFFKNRVNETAHATNMVIFANYCGFDLMFLNVIKNIFLLIILFQSII